MTFFLKLFSRLPFFILHRFSELLFFVLFYIIRYRRKVVHENIRRSFPKETSVFVSQVERKFYQNFCDLIIETIKTTTISPEAVVERCLFAGQANADAWYETGKNLNGLSSHLANWEWQGLAMALQMKQTSYAVYKPLHNQKMNAFMLKTRGRLGLILIAMKNLREVFKEPAKKPFILGLLSDQAPHDYAKAFEIEFLNQKTYYVPGPGLLTVEHDMIPVWGWMRRTGRSRFEWGLDPVEPDLNYQLSENEKLQVSRVANAYQLNTARAETAFRIVKEYSRLLEEKIKASPADWLWSHRRWKSRA